MFQFRNGNVEESKIICAAERGDFKTEMFQFRNGNVEGNEAIIR